MARTKKVVEDSGPGVKSRIRSVIEAAQEKNPGLIIGLGVDPEIRKKIETQKIPTGIVALDALLGGGIPRGKMTVKFGPAKSGKTTLSLQEIANYQRMVPDGYAMIIDVENAQDKPWLEKLGVDLDRTIIVPGEDDMETLCDATVSMTRKAKGDIGIILVDSVSALIPRAEYKGKKGKESKDGDLASLADDNMALLVRKLGMFLKKTNVVFSQTGAAGIFITHVYSDISPTGNGRLVPKGGNALAHYSHVSLRFAIRPDEMFKEKVLCPDGEIRELKMGHFVSITVDKTKQSSTQYSEVLVPFRLGMGFDTVMATLNSAIGYGLVEQSGAWYSYQGSKIGQGFQQSLDFLAGNQEIRLDIQTKLSQILAGEPIRKAKEEGRKPMEIEV